jgi:hypothetical protein
MPAQVDGAERRRTEKALSLSGKPGQRGPGIGPARLTPERGREAGFRGMQVCASDRPGLAGQIEGEQIGRAVNAGNSVAIVFRRSAAWGVGQRRPSVVRGANGGGPEAVI